MKQREITIETKPLREACTWLATLKPSSKTLPVLGYAMLTPPTVKGEPGTLACNTLDEAMCVNLAMQAGKLAKPCLVPFALLKRAAAGATEMGAVSVMADPGKTPPTVAWDAGYASMEEGYEPIGVDEFPPLPALPETWSEAGDLLNNYAACLPFTSTDETRHVLTGPAFFPAWKASEKDTVPPATMAGPHMVSTDGRRIEVRPVTGCGLDTGVIIRPCDALRALANLPPGKVGMVQPGDWQLLVLQVGTVTHWSRDIDGSYPNWRQVVSSGVEHNTVWTPTNDECKALAKIARALPRTLNAATVTLAPALNDKPATAVCKSGTATATLTIAEFTGTASAVFSLEFMLAGITEGQVRVHLADDLNPARINGEAGRVHVLMPIRLT